MDSHILNKFKEASNTIQQEEVDKIIIIIINAIPLSHQKQLNKVHGIL